jgi:hypothetical protein
VTKPGELKKTNRPDGLLVERYKGHENWSYRNWAWQFLRRDRDFIRACEAVDSKVREAADVAKEFHLYNFKHYRMGFASKGNPAPRFLVRTIRSVKHLVNINLEDSNIAFRTRLRLGEIWIKFDLNHEYIVGGSIKAQLRVAKTVLKKSMEEYSESQKRSPKKVRRPQAKIFLDLLRSLDAEASHGSLVEGMCRLYPEKFEGLGSDQKSKEAASLMRTARRYSKEVYLSLAVHEAGRPKVRK